MGILFTCLSLLLKVAILIFFGIQYPHLPTYLVMATSLIQLEKMEAKEQVISY